MLTARIHLRLDDDFAEITDALLGILYPHYLAPDPVDDDRAARTRPRARHAAGRAARSTGTALLYAKPVGGVRCRFRTGYPRATLWPLEVASAELVSAAALRRSGCPTASARRCASACARWAASRSRDLRVRALRFFLDARAGSAHRALRALPARPARTRWFSSGPGEPGALLPASAVRPVGFARDEGLLEYRDESFLGYRLLQEYFAFPEKFLFVELAGLDAARAERDASELDVSVLLTRVAVRARPARVERENLRLGCTPVVNLFEMNVDPIRVTHTAVEYPVTPDVRSPSAYEVYSIDRGQRGAAARARPRRFEPIYTVAPRRARPAAAARTGTRRGAARCARTTPAPTCSSRWSTRSSEPARAAERRAAPSTRSAPTATCPRGSPFGDPARRLRARGAARGSRGSVSCASRPSRCGRRSDARALADHLAPGAEPPVARSGRRRRTARRSTRCARS